MMKRAKGAFAALPLALDQPPNGETAMIEDHPRWQQMTGVLLVMTALLKIIREKGLLSELEIDAAIETAEISAMTTFAEGTGDEYRNAALLPIRVLRLGNMRRAADDLPSAEAIADYLAGRSHEM